MSETFYIQVINLAGFQYANCSINYFFDIFSGEIIHYYRFLIQINKSMGIQIPKLSGFVHGTGQEFWFICQKVVALHRDTCYLAPSFYF